MSRVKKNRRKRAVRVFKEDEIEQISFLKKVYLNLALGVAALIGVEYIFMQTPVKQWYIDTIGLNRWQSEWLPIFLVFIFAMRYAQRASRKITKKRTQYLIYGLFILVKSIVLFPLLCRVEMTNPSILFSSAVIATGLFCGLTIYALTSNRDFTFLRGFIKVGGMVLFSIFMARILLRVAGYNFASLNIGWLISAFIVLYATAAILYKTDDIKRRYTKTQYVVAALALMASYVLLFTGILRLQQRRNRPRRNRKIT